MKLLTNKSLGKARIIVLLVFASLQVFGVNVFAQSNSEKLVWQDEFDGTTLDESKWGYELGDGCPALCQWGTGQLDYSRKENVTVSNGLLTLSIKKENLGAASNNRDWTTGRIRTYQKVNFKYGRIEARLKGVETQGHGFAFWMLGSNAEVVSWPKCGEIDIFEQTGKFPDKNIGTTHFQESYGHAWNQGYIYLEPGDKFASNFHTVGLEWTPDSMSWYMNDANGVRKYYHTFHISEPINGYDPFNRDFYLIMSVGMGGDYSGAPDATTLPQQDVQIDYVRLYEGPQHIFVDGPSTVYEGDAGKVYSTKAQAGATYNWSVPAGSTITSGQGTNEITVNFGSTSGKVNLTETLVDCDPKTVNKEVTVEKAIVTDNIYEDFELNRNCTYDYRSGVLTEEVTNPAPNSVNSSPKVGQYIRNISENWDALVLVDVHPGHAGEFVQGTKRLFMDVYTDAPIGTKVTLGFENSAVASPDFPYGKHSNYAAYTSKQNSWERLEFELTDVPDKYAGAYKVDKFVLMFDQGVKSGNTWYFDNLRSGQSGGVTPVLSEKILEDCDGNTNISLRSATGAYAKIANPVQGGINVSPTVIQYNRNAGNNYDNISYRAQFDDASLFRDGTNTISFDVYTNATPGKVISLHFEDSTIVGGQNWEAPIHSIYEGRIEKQGEWQTVVFKWSSTPGASVPNVNVNKMVFLIDENSNNGDIYYIDNIKINSNEQPASYVESQIIENYDDQRHLNLVWTGEVYNQAIANPYPTGINTSAKVGQYVRHAGNANDWLVVDLLTPIDAKALKQKSKIFALDVYTNAPAGKVVTIGLEAGSLATSGNWPTGRHSDYASAIKVQNEWQTLKFIYSSSADGSTPDNLVNKMILTTNQGQGGDYTYYFDNLRVLELVKDTVLYTIDVTPTLSQNIALNQTIQFTAAGKDQFGKPFTTTPTWSVTGGGTISATGLFTAKTKGVYKVTATDGSVIGRADILIGEPIKLSKITLSPASSTITQGGSVQLVAAGYDQLSKPIAIPAPTYEITPAGASINNGLFTSNIPGIYSVKVTSGSISATSVITVRANSELSSLSILPLAKKITLGSTQQFTAAALDQYGKTMTVPLTWTANGATISNSGLFSASAIGTYVVEVQSGSFKASTYISVIEAAQNIALGKPVTASTYENYGTIASYVNDGIANTRWSSASTDAEWIRVDLGQVYKLSSVVLTWEAAYGKEYKIQGSTNDVTFTDIASETNGSAGSKTYNVSANTRYLKIQGVKRGTGYGYSLFEIEAYGVIASPSVLSSIVVTPNSSEIAPNTTKQFTCNGFDQYGDAFAVTPTWGANGGSISASGVYKPAGTGTFNVTATSGAISGAAQITVRDNAAPTVSIITPIDGSTQTAPSDVIVGAQALDSDGTIAQVEFFVDGISKGVVKSAPFAIILKGLTAGNYIFTAIATDNNGLTSAISNSVSIVLSIPTSIDKEIISNDVSIYPNPLEDQLNINLPANHEFNKISIFTAAGSCVLSTSIDTITTELHVDLSELAKGVYIVKLGGNDINKTIKIVKK